jgi:hypothetical protein
VVDHLGRIRSPRESFAALVAAGRWVTKAERERLREEPFYVLEARARHESGGTYEAQSVFVIVAPGLWDTERRLLGLTAYPSRAAFARELAGELRDADAVGPFTLGRKETASGREAWRFVASTPADAAGG